MSAPNENALAGGTAQGAGKAGFAGLPHDPTTARRRPRLGTARADILACLVTGQTLTSRDAWLMFGASRLAADIHALRHMGWPIVGEETRVRCRRGRLSTVTTYCLDRGSRHER